MTTTANPRAASMEKIANELGIACWTLRRWVRADRPASESPAPKQPDLQERVRRLEAENKQLRMERDILKKAAAYFARG